MHITTQCFRINPLYRKEHPENLERLILQQRSDFAAFDAFICTADPHKEPPMNVVNTALSVMAYDYVTKKVSVYVSDDGGSELTLFAFVVTAKFARSRLPFCRENKIVERCPEAFFEMDDDDHSRFSKVEEIKILYRAMKVRVNDVIDICKVDGEYVNGERERHAFSKWTDGFTPRYHSTIIEIRVSAAMTNAPIILTLDCDIYSNDPRTPYRALCYFSDSKLRYVQFPQRFRRINKNDTYGYEHKTIL